MLIAASGAKVVPARDMDAGTFFFTQPRRGFIPLYVVISGGTQISQKLTLALNGPEAFRAHRLDQLGLTGVIYEPRSLFIELPGNPVSVEDARRPGTLIIDAQKTALGIEWSPQPGLSSEFIYVDTGTWEMDASDRRDGQPVPFGDWKLVDRFDQSSITLAAGPALISSAARS